MVELRRLEDGGETYVVWSLTSAASGGDRPSALVELVRGWRRGHVVWQEANRYDSDSVCNYNGPTKMALTVFDLAAEQYTADIRFERKASSMDDPTLCRVAGADGIFVVAYPEPDPVVIVGHVSQTSKVPIRMLRRLNCVYFPFGGGFLMYDRSDGTIKKLVFAADDGEGNDATEDTAGPSAKKTRDRSTA